MKKKINKYNQNEIAYVRNVGYTDRDVALITGRTEEAIKAKRYSLSNPQKMRIKNRKQKEKVREAEAERLGGRKYDYWTKDEIKLILNSKYTDAQLSEMLGRTTNSIQKKRHRLLKERANGKNKKST